MFSYHFWHLVVALKLLLLMISLKLKLGTEAVVDLPVIVLKRINCDKRLFYVTFPPIVLFIISLGNTLVYHGLIMPPNAKVSFDLKGLRLILFTLCCFFDGWLVVFNLFVDCARLRKIVRNLAKPFQAVLILSGSEPWGPLWKVITFTVQIKDSIVTEMIFLFIDKRISWLIKLVTQRPN